MRGSPHRRKYHLFISLQHGKNTTILKKLCLLKVLLYEVVLLLYEIPSSNSFCKKLDDGISNFAFQSCFGHGHASGATYALLYFRYS